MKTLPTSRAPGIILGLLLWYAASAADPVQPERPADITMNKSAGRMGMLVVTIRLESGEELPFMVDTGAPVTLFDRSLESKLGKRLGTMTAWNFGASQESGIYAAPKLYLGNTLLMTGTNVFTFNFHGLLGRSRVPIMGMLGMDCLRHYCIQLDFEAGKMRFLDPGHLETARLGKGFPLAFSSENQSEAWCTLPYLHHTGLLGGTSTNCLVDTGFNIDGMVESGLMRGHYLTRTIHFFVRSRGIRLPECVWDGNTYNHLIVQQGKNANIVGLRFLARHLVTLDFPGRTMYLQRCSAGPLSDKASYPTAGSASAGPGWSGPAYPSN